MGGVAVLSTSGGSYDGLVLVAGSFDDILSSQGLAANGALGALGQTGLGTTGSNGRNGLRGVGGEDHVFSLDLLICQLAVSAGGAVIKGLPAVGGAGGSLAVIVRHGMIVGLIAGNHDVGLATGGYITCGADVVGIYVIGVTPASSGCACAGGGVSGGCGSVCLGAGTLLFDNVVSPVGLIGERHDGHSRERHQGGQNQGDHSLGLHFLFPFEMIKIGARFLKASSRGLPVLNKNIVGAPRERCAFTQRREPYSRGYRSVTDWRTTPSKKTGQVRVARRLY